MKTTRPDDTQRRRRPATPAPESPSAPVKLWAAIGLAASAVIVWSVGAWIMSPDFTPSPAGTDPFGGGRLVLLRIVEGLSAAGGAYFLWRFVVHPLIRDRSLPFDGMLVIGTLTLWWQDPIDNYFNFTFAYNAHFWNHGSWARYIPGWEAPRGQNFGEPHLLVFGFYCWFALASAMVGSLVIRHVRARRPGLSRLGVYGAVFGAFVLLDFVFEFFFIRTRLFGYTSVVHSLSFWGGTMNQFPIYELFPVAGLLTGWTVLREHRDDRGLSWPERGVESLRIPSPMKAGVRLAALIGMMHVWMFVSFFLPYSFFAMKADVTARDIPSYLRLEICGEETGYACPDAEVPVAHDGSIHLAPDDPRLRVR